MTPNEQVIQAAYQYFNSRALDKVLPLLAPDVQWANGWEGGHVSGREEVAAYWTRQWSEINPVVTPEGMELLPDGRLAVRVHQVVKDGDGNTTSDSYVRHLYTFNGPLIAKMEIEHEA